MNQIMYLKWVSAIYKTCQFITLQENVNVTFVSFSSTAAKLLFLCIIFGVPRKDVWCIMCIIQTCTKFFSILNLVIIFINSFTCNDTTFSVSYLNELLFKLYSLLSAFKTCWLTDWLTYQAFLSDATSFQIHPSPSHNSEAF